MNISQSQPQSNPPEKFQPAVRDRRGRRWLWLDHELMDRFGAALGPNAIAAYVYLCRLADDETQTCFPSFKTIAVALGVSRPTAVNAIARLVEYSIIDKEDRVSQEGDATSNLYTLRPANEWKPPEDDDETDTPKPPKNGDLRGGKKSLPPGQGKGGSKESLSGGHKDSLLPGGKESLHVQRSTSTLSKKDSEIKKDVQQQQDADASAAVAPSAKASETTVEAETLFKTIFDFETGLDTRFMKEQIQQYPEHCARVAECWPELPEADADYWQGRKGTPAGALRNRLADPNWLPPKLYGQKRAAQKREEAQAARREEAERAAAKKQEDAEALAIRTKQAWGILQKLDSLSGEQRKATHADILKRPETQFIGDSTDKRGGFSRLDKRSLLWVEYLEAADFVMKDVLRKTPALPELQRKAPGEEMEDDDGVEYFDIEPDAPLDPAIVQAVIERQINRFTEEIRAEVLELDELDSRRVDWDFDDEQWQQIKTAVAARMESTT